MAENDKRTQIFNKVSEIVADHFDIDRAKITDDLNLKTDLDADSIDFVEFVLELEDTFNAEIADDEAEKLSTIGEVVDYIDQHTADWVRRPVSRLLYWSIFIYVIVEAGN